MANVYMKALPISGYGLGLALVSDAVPCGKTPNEPLEAIVIRLPGKTVALLSNIVVIGVYFTGPSKKYWLVKSVPDTVTSNVLGEISSRFVAPTGGLAA